MKYLFNKLFMLGFLILVLSVITTKTATAENIIISSGTEPMLDVYKSPSCGCCQNWIDHAEHAGFHATAHDTDNMSQIKAERGILPQYQSCHTSVSKDGFIFEGHIPANLVKRFLANPPADAIGLAVPGMPMGSPGMEMGNRRDDYDVLLLKSDGTSTIFEQIIAAK